MGLVVSDTGSGDFERLEAGLYHAVCSHVEDLGLQETPYGDKLKLAICFETEEKMKDGRPFMFSRIYTQSLNSKATLRQHLESWRGKQFGPVELEGFDVENLLGKHVTLNLVEQTRNDKTYTGIDGLMKPMQGKPPIAPQGQPLPEWIAKIAKAGRDRKALGFSDGAPMPDESQAPVIDENLDGLPF